MVFGVIVGILLIVGVIAMLGGFLKKFLEIASVLLRLLVGGTISMLICKAVGVNFDNQGRVLLYVCIGAVLFFALLSVLASVFRMVGYSINYFINSLLFGLLLVILRENFSIDIGFWLYAAILFFVPRLLWLSDRAATTSNYSGSDYDGFLNVKTYFYTVSPMDWWQDSEGSWRCIPVQIIFAALFYLVGSSTVFSAFPAQSNLQEIIFLVVATAVNILFDLLLFRKLEAKIFV